MIRLTSKSARWLFDRSFYKNQLQASAKRTNRLYSHYVRTGWREGKNSHPLFDTSWYLSRNPDVASAGINPVLHYVTEGVHEGRSPHPLFDTRWYLDQNKDVAAANINPLLHFITAGAAEGRSPHPLFDMQFYLARNPDVAAGQTNGLVHYLLNGGAEGRRPSPLFDGEWYYKTYPDVKNSDINPLLHFLYSGSSEGRNPNQYFNTKWYLSSYADVEKSVYSPVAHYIVHGAKEGRDPHPHFSTNLYLINNVDVAASGQNPLGHYLTLGQSEGRFRHNSLLNASMATHYASTGEYSAAALTKMREEGLSSVDRYFNYKPLNVYVDPQRAVRKSIWILLPGIHRRHATGGPNTAYILGCLLAKRGYRVNFVYCDAVPDRDLGPIKKHLLEISGVDVDKYGVGFFDASDRDRALRIGYNDILFATAWWTAQPAKAAASFLRNKRFYYLIQDYESLFYGASVTFAVAEETYEFDHLPIINTNFLKDHLAMVGVGRYLDPKFVEKAIVFEPAVDTSYFYKQSAPSGKPKRLLFYTRPTVAERNLFGLGLLALRSAVETGLFGDSGWEFIGMGESFEPIPLGKSYELKPAPWLGFEKYAEQMRESDILLSLMMSPRPSYPPLEMAACGGFTVTTTFGSKTAERLRRISPSIIGVRPTLNELVSGLAKAVARAAGRTEADLPLTSQPKTWVESLDRVIPAIIEQLELDGLTPGDSMPAPKTVIRTDPLITDQPGFFPGLYPRRLMERQLEYRPPGSQSLLSIITTVYNTEAVYLYDLAHSIFGQSGDIDFEWVILDNGTTAPDTIAAMKIIAQDPRVRQLRETKNLGIVGGMRTVLQAAKNRYVVPVDSDDLLFPDCLSSLSAFIEQNLYPDFLYTDEDKTTGQLHREAYLKPDWDPVLLPHTCYIAHLTAISREKALELDCYSDPRAEGCHDWDTFLRFMLAGYTPSHLNDVLYSWRIHSTSTSADVGSKPYVGSSHTAVLENFLRRRSQRAFKIERSPLFGATLDYRFVAQGAAVPRANIELPRIVKTLALRSKVSALPRDCDIVRLVIDGDGIEVGSMNDSEADSLFALFPDAVIVGGRLHDGEMIKDAGYVFAFEGAIGCPDRGRALTHSGYCNLLWKPHSVAAVSARCCYVKKSFLASYVQSLPDEIDIDWLGPYLGAFARIAHQRVIYSPVCEVRVATSESCVPPRSGVAQYLARFNDLAYEDVGYIKGMDLSGATPFTPNGRRAPPPLVYEEIMHANVARWLERRGTTLPKSKRITLATTVYIKTDVAAFEEAVASVQAQSRAPHEWLVLAHGPIPVELETLLHRLHAHEVVHFLQIPENLGIHGGLRYCLEQASGEFFIPLDADDLLTAHAVDAFESAVEAYPDNKIFYSDEDIPHGGVPMHPFYRPDYDPIHLRTHSFIWLVIAFDIRTAFKLKVYTNKATEYAQDWDTLLRFEHASLDAVHVREVLYHWRQHASSLSNSGSINAESTNAVRNCLEMVRVNLRDPSDYDVAAYPADVGMPDFYVRRLPKNPLPIARLAVNRTPGDADSIDYPFSEMVDIGLKRDAASVAKLMDKVRVLSCEYLFLYNGGMTLMDVDGLWQALRHFDFSKSVVAVAGPTAKLTGQVAQGLLIGVTPQILIDPLLGRSFVDRGNLMLSLMKPQCISAIYTDAVICRRDFMLASLQSRPDGLCMRSLGVWLGMCCESSGQRLVYEPLFRSFVRDDSKLLSDTPAGATRALQAMGGAFDGIRGTAAFERFRHVHAL